MKTTILKSIFTIVLGLSFLGSTQSVAHADATKFTDTSGSITGTAGSTYYQVSSWPDINQAYSTDSGTNVYVQAQTDFAPDDNLIKDNAYKLISGKSLIIDGNNKVLSLSATNTTTNSGGQQSLIATRAFSDSSSNSTSSDTFQLKNATLLNNVTNGLFQINGLGNITYQNVIVTNQNASINARPFFNWRGTITLSGQNQFNIIAGVSAGQAGNGVIDMKSSGFTSTADTDANGEWIRGNPNIDVYGTATLNYNWQSDQPYYAGNITTPLSIHVHDDANLYWNMNKSYSISYGEAPINWQIDNDAAFIISGSSDTFKNANYSATKFDLSIGDNSTFSSISGGSITKFNSLTTGVNDKINIQNIGLGRAISSTYSSSSSMSLSDSTDATFSSAVANTIYPTSLSISLLGNGLATNASKLITPDMSTNSFTKDAVSGTFTSAFTSALFLNSEQSILQSAKYIHWYPIKAEVGFLSNTADRSFHITPDMLTHNQEFSSPINGDTPMAFVIHSSASVTPSLSLSVKLTKNNTPDITQYVWRSIDGSISAPLSSTALVIATMSPTQNLTSNITKSTSTSGSDYNITFNANQGLLLQSKNMIQAGTFQNATMTYEITNGPN